MKLDLEKELAGMERMATSELKAKYAEVFGEKASSHNRTWLTRRIAWRLQANAYGGLSERALARARELANDADLRVTAPRAKPVSQDAHKRTTVAQVAVSTDDRLPIPGSVIVRNYKGRALKVKVLPKGFEFEGEVFKSLSAVAKHVTGSHCNGYLFFRLAKEAAQ